MTKLPDADRRTIEELVTLLTVEPSLRDVIVEGRSDAAAIRWYLRQHGLKAQVYAVDDRVFVPSDIVRKIGLDVNNRGEVIALALTAGHQVPANTLTCIADSDFRILLDSERYADNCSNLLFTDFSALECYALESQIIDKLLRLVLAKDEDIEANALLVEMMDVLVDLFLVRAAIRSSSPEDGLIERFERCIHKKKEKFLVDIDDLIRRSLPSDVTAQKAAMRSYAELKEKVPLDKRRAIRGHDIGKTFIRLTRIGGKFGDHEILERALMGCLEASILDSYPLFEELRSRISV